MIARILFNHNRTSLYTGFRCVAVVWLLFSCLWLQGATKKGPHIVRHPESQIIQPGEAFTLNVDAEGPGQLSYQWVFDGQVIEGANGPQWTVAAATPDHTGNYGVTVVNEYGIAQSAIARVTVITGERIELSDSFSNRPELLGLSGMVVSDNFGATREEEEPEHGEHKRGSSVWATWVAPADGIVTFSTAGSEFDTIIAVYADKRFLEDDEEEDDEEEEEDEPASDNPIKDLESISDDDDDSDLLNTGKVQFLAAAGVPYQVAVEGYEGQQGQIVLSWDFLSLDQPLPVILQIPLDRSIREGDSLELSVNYEFGDDVEIKWLADGRFVDGGEGGTLVIPGFSADDIARYQLQFKTEQFDLLTPPVEIQINSEGRSNTFARDKLKDAVLSPLTAPDPLINTPAPQSPFLKQQVGLRRGFNGVQIFETLFASKDPLEPDHCDVPGGASYWFVMNINESGTLVLDTLGSNFDTVIAVYTSRVPVPQFADLTLLDCNNDLDGTSQASRVAVQLNTGTTCYVVVDGVNGAKGSVQLNYAYSDTKLDLGRLLSIQPRENGQMVAFQVSAVPGFQYHIEYRDYMHPSAPWTTLTNTGILTQRQMFQFQTSALLAPSRYYRITAQPPGVASANQ
jgi:hypothetical protein